MERTMEGRSVVGVKGEVGQGCRSISKMRCFLCTGVEAMRGVCLRTNAQSAGGF